jgi:hypothetical protein
MLLGYLLRRNWIQAAALSPPLMEQVLTRPQVLALVPELVQVQVLERGPAREQVLVLEQEPELVQARELALPLEQARRRGQLLRRQLRQGALRHRPWHPLAPRSR